MRLFCCCTATVIIDYLSFTFGLTAKRIIDGLVVFAIRDPSSVALNVASVRWCTYFFCLSTSEIGFSKLTMLHEFFSRWTRNKILSVAFYSVTPREHWYTTSDLTSSSPLARYTGIYIYREKWRHVSN